MAQATLTTVSALLKEVYEGRLESQHNEEVVTLRRIEKTSDGVTERAGGKYVDFPIKIKRNQGISYRQEWEQLAPAGKQGYAEVHVPLYYGYGRVRFSSQMMELAEKDYQSFASAMDEEMDGLKDDVVKDSNRIAQGNGKGVLAKVAVDMGGAGNAFVVDDITWLEEDQVVDILVIATGAALAVGRNITAIDEDTKTVTVDGAAFTATTPEHGLFRDGNYAAGTQREPSGLGSILSKTAPLHGLDPATVRKWKANITALNGALSESAMIKMCDDIRTKGGKVSVIFTSLGVRRAYFNLLTQQRRYTDTKEFAGGFQGLPFNYGTEIPVVEDPDHGPGTMEFLTEKEIKIYRTKPWHWGADDGNTLKWVNGYDGWEAFLRQYWEIGTSARNRHGQLTGITEA